MRVPVAEAELEDDSEPVLHFHNSHVLDLHKLSPQTEKKTPQIAYQVMVAVF